jgi:hypothetical protein
MVPERASVDHRTALAMLAGVVVVATGCTSSPPTGHPATGRAASSAEAVSGVVVTRDDRTLPSKCRPAAVAMLLTGFFDALEGPAVPVGRFFAPAPRFQWYSVTEGGGGGVDGSWRERPTFARSRLLLGPNGRGRHFVTHDPASLRRYLDQRQDQHERMSLLVVDVGEQRGPPHPEAGIAYVVRRTADDLESVGITAGLAQGKAAIDCDSGRIFVWSMGMEGSPASSAHDTLEILCPAPPAGPAGDAVVACARA